MPISRAELGWRVTSGHARATRVLPAGPATNAPGGRASPFAHNSVPARMTLATVK
jgi:hypothetical protein